MYDLAQIDRDNLLKGYKEGWFGFFLAALICVSAPVLTFLVGAPILFGGSVFAAGVLVAFFVRQQIRQRARRNRFLNPYFQERWEECEVRVAKFDEAMGLVKKAGAPALSEMPRTVYSVAKNLYNTLRVADIVASDLQASEGVNYDAPDTPASRTAVSVPYVQDRQSHELWLAADKNRAEYRRRLKLVQAGIIRSDAQVEVFITAMDALRLNLMGVRLSGAKEDASSHALLTSLAEIRLQMESITSALDELDFGLYPKTVSIDGSRAGSAPFKDDSEAGLASPGSSQEPAAGFDPGLSFESDEEGKIISLNLNSGSPPSVTTTPPPFKGSTSGPPPFRPQQ